MSRDGPNLKMGCLEMSSKMVVVVVGPSLRQSPAAIYAMPLETRG